MCGRITQHRGRQAYAEEMGWAQEDRARQWWHGTRTPSYNEPPGKWPDVMHTLTEGKNDFDTIHWGYRPAWAVEKGFPQQINARVENAMTKPFYRALWRAGRVIVPADGWFEWTSEKGRKLPWYIRLKIDRPMFLAAITDWRPHVPPAPESGFVIVTAASDGGMVDVHDRRPVVLAPDDARLWVDNSLPPEQAEMLARSRCLPTEAFEWFRVSTDVNKVGNNAPHLIEPVADLT